MPDQTTTTITTAAAELAAMRKIVATLNRLDPAVQDRIVGWMFDRYRQPVEEPQR